MNLRQRINLAWRVLTARTGNLYEHAERELGAGMDIELRELLLVFSSQGHSGGSAAITADVLNKLLRDEPIGPLTGDDHEWLEVAPACSRTADAAGSSSRPTALTGRPMTLTASCGKSRTGGDSRTGTVWCR